MGNCEASQALAEAELIMKKKLAEKLLDISEMNAERIKVIGEGEVTI